MSTKLFLCIVMLLASFITACNTITPTATPIPTQTEPPTPLPTFEPILPGEAKIEEILVRMVDQEKRATGMVIGMIAPNEKVVVGYGHWNDTDRRVPDSQTLFEIGSVSKVFVGILLMDAVQRGEIRLEDPASKYFPASVKMPDFQGTPITLLDLATHTSSLPRNMSFPPGVKDTEEDWVPYMYEFLSNHELSRKPGTSYDYSNLGITILAHILELHYGKPYEDILMERIIEPLGMKNTRLVPTGEMLTLLATGHNSVLQPIGSYTYQRPYLRYVGSIVSNADDMLTFASALMGLSPTPLQSVFKEMSTPRRSGGYERVGVIWNTIEGSFPIVYHAGDTFGMHAFLGIDPKRQVAVIELANGQNAKNDIGMHLLHPQRYVLESYSPRVLPPPVELTREILASYVGDYELDGTIINISLDGDVLYSSVADQETNTLLALSETRFAVVEFEGTITFVMQNGKVTGLILDQSNAPEDYTFTRITP